MSRVEMRKGALTKGRIVDRALELAARDGLRNVSIGQLADALEMSRSGLFAHFRSKEQLQLDVIRAAIERFRGTVITPALHAPAGAERLRTLLERWITWDSEVSRTGCPFTAFSMEFDHVPGPVRDMLVEAQRAWLAFLSRTASDAIAAGALPDTARPEVVAFQLQGLLLSYHHARHLLDDPRAKASARAGLEALLVGSGGG